MSPNPEYTKVFRAEKTTKNRDDVKVLIVGIIIAILIMLISLLSGRLQEYRWYRDITYLTPFSKVMLLTSTVSEDGLVLQVGGIMKKDRCDFDFKVENNPVGYVTGQYNQRHRVPVNTRPEDVKTGVFSQSRPPGSDTEFWGPWEIDVSGMIVFGEPLHPKSFEIVVFHTNCPTIPKDQINQFVQGNWGNFEIKLPYGE